jgi:sugar lactone lactonase YvrE
MEDTVLPMKSRRLSLWLHLSAALAPALAAQSNYATPYVLTPFAGVASIGSADGQGAAARFYFATGLAFPSGLATDVVGNLYVADVGNQTIRKITPGGLVSTVAGLPGARGGVGGVNGTGSAARFADPLALTLDHAGNLYVADFNGYNIRKISPAGAATTLADTNSGAEWPDHPAGIATDAADNIYYTDEARQTVMKITPTGVINQLAGRALTAGNIDGAGETARFSSPTGIAADPSGNLYVTQSDRIRKITPAGDVTTLPTAPGITDASSWSVAIDPSGNLFVAAPLTSVIGKIAPDGTASVLAGNLHDAGYQDGPAATARFFQPSAVTTDRAGNVFVADGNNVIRKITPAGQVSTLAGLALSDADGSTDGKGDAARFSEDCFVALAPNGDLMVLDSGNHTIRKITPDGVVTTVAGQAGAAGIVDGVGSSARFDYMSNAITVDAAGNTYIADRKATGPCVIRKITPAGAVSTLPGSDQVMDPQGLAVDATGNVFYSEYNSIQRLGVDGRVTTHAGLRTQNPSDSFSAAGTQDGPRGTARFYNPAGLAIDQAGNLYVADSSNSTIRKVTPDGTVTTLAGLGKNYGFNDGKGSEARFTNPRALAIDAMGNLYIADQWADVIRKLAPDGTVTTLAGLTSAQGNAPGTGAEARLHWPQSIAVTPDGILYVPNFNVIYKGQAAGPPTVTRHPQNLSVAAGDSAQFSVTATAAPSPTYQWRFNGTAIPGATGNTLTIASVATANAGSYAVVVTNALGSVTSNAATLTVTTASANPPPGGGGPGAGGSSGGGGAPSEWFLVALASLGLLRRGLKRSNRCSGRFFGRGRADRDDPIVESGNRTSSLPLVTPFLFPAGFPSHAIRYFAIILLTIGPAKLSAQTTNSGPVYRWTTVAGRASLGSEDGPAGDARFNNPHALAQDQSGNLYVADTGNHTIRKITPAGVVTTFAGSADEPGNTDGNSTTARFRAPEGVAVDLVGNVYVADTGNHIIRKITPAGVVTTLAGRAGEAGQADGALSTARFDTPGRLTVDSRGNIYLADHGVRLISGDRVETLAVPARVTDPDGKLLTLHLDRCPAVDAAGNLFFSTDGPSQLAKVTPAMVATVVRDSNYGTDTNFATYAHHFADDTVFSDASGNLLLVTLIRSASIPRVFQGARLQPDGSLDPQSRISFTSHLGQPLNPLSVVRDAAGHWYYTRSTDDAIMGDTGPFAGTPLPPDGVDAAGPAARLEGADYVGVDPTGNVWVAEAVARYPFDPVTFGFSYGTRVRRISPSGLVTTPAQPWYPAAFNLFDPYHYPSGLSVDLSGTVTLVRLKDSLNLTFVVNQFFPDGTVTEMIAPRGYADDPVGDNAGHLYARNFTNVFQFDPTAPYHRIVSRQADGTWATLAGSAPGGIVDGAGTAAHFNSPSSLTLDRRGNLFLIDTIYTNNQPTKNYIRKIDSTGLVTTISRKLVELSAGLAVDTDGNCYLTDASSHQVTRLDPQGKEVVIGGLRDQAGSLDGNGTAARFARPGKITLDAQNSLYLTDGFGTTVRKGVFLGYAPAFTTQPESLSVSAGGTASFSAAASSSPAASYQWYFNGSAVPGATANTLSLAGVTVANAGNYTVVATNAASSTTSATATLSVSAPAPAGPANLPATGSGSSGGGAPSLQFLVVLGALGLARRRRTSRS